MSDTIHEGWSAVWKQPMAETLTILAYIHDLREKERKEYERELQKIKR